MRTRQKRFLLLLVFFSALLWINGLFATKSRKPPIQPQMVNTENYFPFTENKGQWRSNIQYQADLPLGRLYLESNCLTYCFLNELPHAHGLKEEEEHHNHASHNLKAHAYRIHFEGSNAKPNLVARHKSPDYASYFKGENATSFVHSYKTVTYQNLYSGIDLAFYTQPQTIKYDFILQPGADPRQIQLRYEGVDNLFLQSGRLVIRTSINEIQEAIPKAYQVINGKEKIVPCEYTLREGNTVAFEFPKGYNPSYPLVIDPVLVFGTLTGSTTDNWGFTATYDDEGNLYSGGIAFSFGYPTSTGALQVGFAGGIEYSTDQSLWYDSDIAIIKYNATGTARIWATYLGGRDNEQPHSLIVNSNNELFMLGATRSNNFPVTLNAYDRTHNGGIDIVVTRFNANASQLLGSTYLGGRNDDGINLRGEQINPLYKFYADDSRGEIILDREGNPIIASSSNSTDFPTLNAVQTTLRGQQDAVIFKMASNLGGLQWSTYLGGNRLDAGYSLKADSNGDIYVVGGTNSVADFPITSDTWSPVYSGGVADGFIVHLRGTGGRILRGTYVGTSAYDQIYMVDLDAANNVYVVGQTEGNYPIRNAIFSVTNASQFITKFDPALRNIIFSTRFGSGRATPDITVSAFLVDVCENIYVSGWGGLSRQNNTRYGSTLGMPITPDAYQRTTDGSDFYLIVIRKDAASLFYATYFGGRQSEEHVDGGTSRFDKRGIVYQSVCAGCGRNNDFPTTSGAWSRTNNSNNCNNGAFKLRVDLLEAALADFTPSVSGGCSPLTVNFINRSAGAVSYSWDFGDGGTSSATNPTYTFRNPGRYIVRLVAENPNLCNKSDFTEKIIEVSPGPSAPSAANIQVCERGPGVFTVTVNEQGPVEVSLFTQPSGGTPFSTDAAPPYLLNTPAFSATATYYISASLGGCVSPRTPVIATVVPQPPLPQIVEPKACSSGILTFTLSFAGNTPNIQVALYTLPTGGAPLQTASSAPYQLNTPFITTTTNFFFETRNQACTTARVSARAIIITPPAPPSANDVSLCQNGVVTFTARQGAPAGTELILYNAPNAGQIIARATANPAFLTTPLVTQTTTFYLEAVNDICTSRRAPVVAIIDVTPAPPTAADIRICGASVVTFSPQITSPAPNKISLFTQASGGASIAEANAPPFLLTSPIVNASTTFYLESAIGACTSARSPVVVTFTPIPGSPLAPELRLCGPGLATFTAIMGSPSGNQIHIYSAPLASSPISEASSPPYTLPVGITTQTQTFYIASFLGECGSPRTPVVVTVVPNPTPPEAENLTLCQAGIATFTILSNGSLNEKIYLYTTPIGAGPIDSANHSLNSRLVTPVLSQNATFYLESRTAPWCVSPRIPIEVTVLPPFTIQVENNGKICANPATSFTLNATEYPGATYNWQGPLGFTAAGANIRVTQANSANSGVYQVRVAALGCEYNLNAPVTILQTPVVQAQGNSPLCPGNEIRLTANSDILGVTWQWSGPVGFAAATANVNAPNARVEQSGIYSVTATNGFCPSLPATVLIDISDQNLEIEALSPLAVCEAGSVTLTASSLAGASYRWSGPNNFSSSLQNPTITNAALQNSGLYSVSAIFNGCTSRTAVVLLEVHPLPVVNITCRSRFVCAGDSIVFWTNSIPGARYQWTGPANFNATERNPVIPNAQTIHRGRYTLQAFVGSCASRPESLVIFVLDLAPPQLDALNLVRCGAGPITYTVTATEPQTDILFYDENLNLLDRKSQIPALFTVNLTTPNARYYFSCISPEDCESEKIPVTANFIATPGIPTAPQANRCGGGPVTFTAQMGNPAGQTLRLFTQPIGGVPIAVAGAPPYLLTAPNISTPTLFYLESAAAQNCASSSRLPVLANIYPPAPTPVAAGNLTRCGEGNITFSVLAPGANSMQLFSSESATQPLASAVTLPFVFTSPWLTTTTTFYLVSQTPEGCQSPKTPMVLTLAPAVAPIVTNVRRCEAGSLTFTMSASGGGEFRLYSEPIGGIMLARASNPPYTLTTPWISRTTTFYIEQITGGACVSSRAPAIAEIITVLPGAPTANAVQRCGSGSVVIRASMGVPEGSVIRVYDEQQNRIAEILPPYEYLTPTLTRNTTYFLESYDEGSGCVSAQTSVVALIRPIPAILSMPDVWRCGGGRVTFTVTTNTPEATVLHLYTQQTGGAPLQTLPIANGLTTFSFTTEPTNNNFTYYAAVSSLTCGEGARVKAEATIGPLLDLQAIVTHGIPGQIVAQASGGFPPYTYRLENRTQTSPIFENLLPGAYLLRLTDSRNCVATQQVTIRGFVCAEPVSPQVQRDPSGKLLISWPAVEGATGYELEYRELGQPEWEPKIILTEPRYFFRELLPETMYEARIRTICGEQYSGYTPLQFPTPICNAINFLFMTEVTEASGIVNWSLMENATAYEFTWRRQGERDWQPTELLTTDRRPLFNLERGTTYEVRVRTICYGGSVIADFVYQTFTTLKCDAVTELVATDVTANSVILRWEPVSDATLYRVSYQRNGSGNWINEIVSNNFLALSGLEPAALYNVRVQTICSSVQSGFSSINFFTASGGSDCHTPVNIRTSSVTAQSVTLAWAATPAATGGYMLQYRRLGEASWVSVNIIPPYTLTGLMPGQTYEFRVRAVCAAGASGFSQVQTFTTLSAKINYVNEERSFQLYPNPTSGFLRLRFYGVQNETLNLQLADPVGNTLWRSTFEAFPGENEQSITLPPHLSTGVYFLLLQKEGEERYIQRFKVQLMR